jgi:hypothetical protein
MHAQLYRNVVALLLVGAISVTLAASGGLFRKAKAPDRGLKSAHDIHLEQGLDCTICHGWEEREHVMPGHELCSVCHEIDESTQTQEDCNFCHTRNDNSVDPLVKRLSVETIFEHADHLQEDESACNTCHSVPGVIPQLPDKPLMSWCMDCHQQVPAPVVEEGNVNEAFTANECAVCHTEITLETRPKYRGETRISHDSPELWMKAHGFEAQFDPNYCATCHDIIASCEDCHRREEPDNHTAAWRRKPHGLQASWDRQNCAVCHEEEFCSECHRSAAPSNHRAGWSSRMNKHCVSCHYPPQEESCTVCHEEIEHETAKRSPHDLGIFPSNCSLCHPGGLPHRAPHVTNNTVRCRQCHQ